MLTAIVFLLFSSTICAASGRPPPVQVRTVAELHGLIAANDDDATYRITAQVLDAHDKRLVLVDESGCIRIKNRPVNGTLPRPGDIIDTIVRRSKTGIPLSSVAWKAVGHGKTQEPVDISGRDVLDGGFLNQFVRISGVIAGSIPDELDSRYNWTVLRTQTGSVLFASSRDQYPLERLKGLIDAEATIKGIVLRYSTWRTRLRGRLEPIGEPPLRLTRPATTNIDEVPPLVNAQILHRQRVSGIVAAVSRDHFFVRLPDGGCLRVQPTDRQDVLGVGRRVTVAGFAEHDPLMELQLAEALVRVDGDETAPMDDAVPISLDDLFMREVGGMSVNHRFNHRYVRLSGRLVEGGAEPGFRTVSDGAHAVNIDLSVFPEEDVADLAPGARISVAGLCVGEFRTNSTELGFPRFSGFTIIPRSAADIVIVSRPPWWTLGRLLAVISVLVTIIIAVLLWNRSLRIVSERRGRELAQEQTNHARAELKVEERTRLAVELHDSISQTLTGVALQIETAMGMKGASFGPAERLLMTAKQMLASCRQELRCCLWDLRSRTFEERDLTEAVRRTIEPHTANANVSVRFNVARDVLSEATVHAILKIVRELVVNAIRHGHARNIHIAGEFSDGVVRFSVRDDGCGFDQQTAPGARQGHFGLQGVRERAAERHGEVRIFSSPGHGTKVTVSIREEMA